jgi:hypothetical protein
VAARGRAWRAQTLSFTGNVDVSGTAARYQTVTAPVDGTLSATLDWTSPTAKLIIVLSRQNPDKSWTWLMNVTGQKPEMLSIPATAGRYRLGVKAKSGASDYSLMANPPDAPPDNTYLTLLFSRSEITVADNCVENDTGVARLDTVVAPELARRGLTGTGTVETGVTRDATYACLHYKKSLAASWSDLAMLRDSYGWSFVSHSRTYAQNWSSMTRQQQLSETCGSLQDLLDHGHTRAEGLFAYPNNSWSADVETNVVSTCFAFGRKYAQRVASRSEVTTAPYWDPTAQVGGGRCNNPGLPCAAGSNAIYRSPDQVAAMVSGLQQGQWLTLQAYVLVTGSRPGALGLHQRRLARSLDERLGALLLRRLPADPGRGSGRRHHHRPKDGRRGVGPGGAVSGAMTAAHRSRS